MRPLRERLGFGRTTPAANDVHLRACIDWLKRAQDKTSDDGVSQTFLLRSRKWAPSYPETAGYAGPTLYRYAARSCDADARAHGAWATGRSPCSTRAAACSPRRDLQALKNATAILPSLQSMLSLNTMTSPDWEAAWPR